MKRTGNDVYITLDERNTISIAVFPVEGSDEGMAILPLTLAEASLLQSQIADAIYRATTEWTEV